MKLLLMILDGWGVNPNKAENAILQANTPNMDRLLAEYPNTLINASGEAVGLPDGQMGNSEVGHLNIGAGRIVYQDLTKISKAIKDGTINQNPVLLAALKNCQTNNSALHLMGLFSDGGVHSHMEHLYGLLRMAKTAGLSKVYVHAFLDGRDVPPRCAAKYVTEFEAQAKEIGLGTLASISGRYYAMDRDNRWDRVELAYQALTELKGQTAADGQEAINKAYERGENDEFVKPTVLSNSEAIKDNDSVIFFNFRPDRARELSKALTAKDFAGFERKATPQVYFVCMTPYDETLEAPIAFPKDDVANGLSETISNAGLKQLHIAETEKYAHVTFFFNGGREEAFANEDRILVPSPQVATYDLKPEMSAYEVTDKLLEAINSAKYQAIIVNYANADMVGHTGIMEAAIKAVEAVDECVGKVVAAALAQDTHIIITADHGNSDQMLVDGKVWTAHSLNKVPLIYVSNQKDVKLREDGVLADIAATALDVLGIAKPADFTQDSLLVK